MTVPRGTHPHWSTRGPTVSSLPTEPWECPDALGVSGIERLAASGKITLHSRPSRRGRAILLGTLIGALIGGAAWYGAHGAEGQGMIASTDWSEVCAHDGRPGSAYSRAHRMVPRKRVPGYEQDHRVPLCLGGADNDANVWLQPIDEALAKDDIERRACIAVCETRTLTLQEGQAIFTSGRWREMIR